MVMIVLDILQVSPNFISIPFSTSTVLCTLLIHDIYLFFALLTNCISYLLLKGLLYFLRFLATPGFQQSLGSRQLIGAE